MLRRLSQGERTVGELAAPLRTSFPAGSKHVRVLERAGFVRRTIVGRRHVCRLNPAAMRRVAEWVEGYRHFWEARFQGLDALLADLKGKEGRHGRG